MESEKQVLTLREKLGCMFMSPGIMLLMFVGFSIASIMGIFIYNFVAGFFETGRYLPLPGITVYTILSFAVLIGIALIRISFYTVKK